LQTTILIIKKNSAASEEHSPDLKESIDNGASEQSSAASPDLHIFGRRKLIYSFDE